jgi:hypothetical protein
MLDIEVVLVMENGNLLLCSFWLLVTVVAPWGDWDGGEIDWLILCYCCRHDYGCLRILEDGKVRKWLEFVVLREVDATGLNAKRAGAIEADSEEGTKVRLSALIRNATIAPGNLSLWEDEKW